MEQVGRIKNTPKQNTVEVSCRGWHFTHHVECTFHPKEPAVYDGTTGSFFCLGCWKYIGGNRFRSNVEALEDLIWIASRIPHDSEYLPNYQIEDCIIMRATLDYCRLPRKEEQCQELTHITK